MTTVVETTNDCWFHEETPLVKMGEDDIIPYGTKWISPWNRGIVLQIPAQVRKITFLNDTRNTTIDYFIAMPMLLVGVAFDNFVCDCEKCAEHVFVTALKDPVTSGSERLYRLPLPNSDLQGRFLLPTSKLWPIATAVDAVNDVKERLWDSVFDSSWSPAVDETFKRRQPRQLVKKARKINGGKEDPETILRAWEDFKLHEVNQWSFMPIPGMATVDDMIQTLVDLEDTHATIRKSPAA